MAELNKIRILIFVSLMIFPACALDVILSNADGNIKKKSEIETYIRNGQKMYGGTLNQFIYQARNDTSKVIVHISSMSRFVEIMRRAVRETRLQIAQELFHRHYELVFLGIENFDDDEYHLISEFLLQKIQPSYNETTFSIETIGEDRFDRLYRCHVRNLPMYQENAQICGGTLLSHLRSIPRGALRPVGSNKKEIKIYEYETEHSVGGEVTWPIHVEDSKYVPVVNVSDPEYNFKMRHPNETIHLIIFSGKEYSALSNIGIGSSKMGQISRILKEMAKNNEVLIILGVFNFDWTEIDIVTQIIVCHSQMQQDIEYNVFTCGFGMFNTLYKDENDGRLLLQRPNPNVAEIMKVLVEEEVKQRSIDMYYLDNNWELSPIPINLSNGRYFVENNIYDFRFPWLNQKIAFMVYDRTEVNDAIDFAIVCQSVENLNWSGIYVVIIEAINFGLDDMHIIAEWIDYHRGSIDSEQIAVLGCGIFDTIFQSEFTTYNTFHNKKNELLTIRNTFVKRANTKGVFALKIDNPYLELGAYPVNTVNGFYEPNLISNINMFDARGGRKLFFIITRAYHFRKIAEMINVQQRTSSFRQRIENYYPRREWSVFFLCLENFDERDSHLFAEFVNAHTVDERPLEEFVCTFSYGIKEAIYQYKDTLPFGTEVRGRVQKQIEFFFEKTCRLPPDTHFH